MPSATKSRITSALRAPSAMRTPISGVRSVTVYEQTVQANRGEQQRQRTKAADEIREQSLRRQRRRHVLVHGPDGIDGQVLVERGHLAAEGGDERTGRYATRGRAARCSTGTLEQRQIEHRPGRLEQVAALDVAHDADDLRRAALDGHALTSGLSSGHSIRASV